MKFIIKTFRNYKINVTYFNKITTLFSLNVCEIDADFVVGRRLYFPTTLRIAAVQKFALR